MKIHELIKKLQEFDEQSEVILMADYDCGMGTTCGDIDEVIFEHNICYLYSKEKS